MGKMIYCMKYSVKSFEKYNKDINAINRYNALVMLHEDDSKIVLSYIAKDKKRKLVSNKNERYKVFFESFGNIVDFPLLHNKMFLLILYNEK